MKTELVWIEENGFSFAQGAGVQYRASDHWLAFAMTVDGIEKTFQQQAAAGSAKLWAEFHHDAICKAIEEAVNQASGKIFDAGFAACKNTLDRWIPCAERLPEPYTKVLLLDRSVGQIVGALYYSNQSNTESFWEVYGGHTFTGPVGINKNNPVTHWMPLPPPPKTEGEETK